MCCMAYKGVNYHYAFEFKVTGIGCADNDPFRIVISKFKESTRSYSGLCLNNELKIISQKEFPFEAFFDIVDKIVHYTLTDRKAFAEANNGQIPSPLMCVSDEDFINGFNRCKKSKESADYYNDLKVFFENPERISEDISENTRLAFWDYLNIMIFIYLIKSKAPYVKDIEAFTI